MKRETFVKILTFGENRLRNVANIHRFFNRRASNIDVTGHGTHRYSVDSDWGTPPDPSRFPVKNCHEMVVDKAGRIILLTNHPKNNILIYNQSGEIIESWTLGLHEAHGLTLAEDNGQEVLFICDFAAARVIKTDLKGNVLLEILPPTQGVFANPNVFLPTQVAVGPNGDIYVVDAYGTSHVVHYDKAGNFIKQYGGKGKLPHNINESHGIAIDTRSADPTLLVTSRADCSFKRFSLDGEYLETIEIPGAYVGRPVIKGDYLYSACCWSHRFLSPNSGIVVILDKDNRVVSSPGGIEPEYKNGELQRLRQADPIFSHCHDVCVDEDENLYVCQWNSNGVYPIKLQRIVGG